MGTKSSILRFILKFLFKRKYRKLAHKWRVKGVVFYLRLINGARQASLAVVAGLVFLQLMALGFIMMVTAGLLLSPLSMEEKLWGLLGAGGFLFLIPAIALLVIFSQRSWYKLSGAERLVRDALKDEP